ncbi:MAG TPA: glycosyltransferase family A protein [Gaiellaceae bacterium]|nr:glycosyltransferase family A protein [Gaiellaceae bacterium]
MPSSLVTVVTPVHNGAAHLAECVESVLAQTYDNWQHVIVDNCSSDRTPEIARSYARRDERIRYLRHDEFVEVVASYNRAFRVAAASEGSFCKLLGADDWLYPECLERMVDLAERHPSVGLVTAYRVKNGKVDLADLPPGVDFAPGHEVLAASLLRRISVIGSPTSILLRSDLVRRRDPFYDESFRHADTEAAYWVLTQSDFALVHRVVTFSRSSERSQSSISTGLNSHRAERVRMVLRYGPGCLSRRDYRRQLRRELAQYVYWHVKQRAKPSRRSDHAFQDFHRRAVELIRAEGSDDADVRRATALVARLLRPPVAFRQAAGRKLSAEG